jgi:hypothetical protein
VARKRLWREVKDSRYWTDPEYRERKRRQSAEYRDRYRNNPTWKRLHYLQCALSDAQDSYARHAERLERIAGRIKRLAKEKEVMAWKWKYRTQRKAA